MKYIDGGGGVIKIMYNWYEINKKGIYIWLGI